MKFFKRLYWICLLFCILCMVFCNYLPPKLTVPAGFILFMLFFGTIGHFSTKAAKNPNSAANRWYRETHRQIRRDSIDYDANMNVYHDMMWESKKMKQNARSARGYEKERLEKEARELEENAARYHRSLGSYY